MKGIAGAPIALRAAEVFLVTSSSPCRKDSIRGFICEGPIDGVRLIRPASLPLTTAAGDSAPKGTCEAGGAMLSPDAISSPVLPNWTCGIASMAIKTQR